MELGEGVAPSVTPPDDTSEESKERIRIRISLFFDGTNNNRTNVGLRETNDPIYQAHASGYFSRRFIASYDNGLSNVARLESNLDRARGVEGYDHYIAVYTEGIGTTDRETDTTRGFALGTGATGIEAKVARGIQTALERVARLGRRPDNTIIEKLTVDTCGFSRGAAAARYCVHCVLHDEGDDLKVEQRLKNAGWEVQQVEVLAVGLFDTVSSHGMDAASEANQSDDVAVLKLNAVRHAAAVLQLAAAEEYRENFSLTNIASAGSKGREIYLPGAHSDVGGGYLDNDAEVKVLLTGEACADVQRFLLTRGWYNVRRDGELTLESPRFRQTRLSANRTGISNRYSFIPLRIMADFFEKHGLSFVGRLNRSFNSSSVPCRADVLAHANGSGGSTPAFWENRTGSEFSRLRNGYLHVSFAASTGMGVRLVRQASGTRSVFRPYRVIHNG